MIDAVPSTTPFGTRVREHVGELLRLAAPVCVSRTGLMVMTTVDAAVVGRYGAEDLAYYGLGLVPGAMLVTVAVGLLFGVLALTARALGAGRPDECGRVFRRALPHAGLIGITLLMLCQAGTPFLRLMGQTEVMAAEGGRVLVALGFGMPGMALFIAATFFLEALKRPVPGMVVIVAGNVLNAVLNVWFVWGGLGLPALGAEGSAWATTVVRWLMAAALFAHIWRLPDRDTLGLRDPVGAWWRDGRELRRFGYASGGSLGIESLAFAALGMFAGLIDPLAVGVYTIVLNLVAVPFMAAVGVGAATGVRVAVSHGRGDTAGMAFAGWTGLGVIGVSLAVVGVAYALWPQVAAAVYTDDPQLLGRVVPLLSLAAWMLVADGAQAVMGNALRGRGDVWVPAALHFVSYAVIMMPLSAVLAFTLGRGERGLIEGMVIASLFSGLALSARFAWRSAAR